LKQRLQQKLKLNRKQKEITMAIQATDNMFNRVYLGFSWVYAVPANTTVYVDGYGVTGGGILMNVTPGVLAAQTQSKVKVTSQQPLDAAKGPSIS
jgi:hypothetical protein